ncbi:MAG: hypothetical protein RML93_08560 [Anaerolineales bacterium]|nr:hypothetical protein [Anaerolineales bacterium]MDW8447328.1 hypothetical protein [Anaerolineales bacterium]
MKEKTEEGIVHESGIVQGRRWSFCLTSAKGREGEMANILFDAEGSA